MCFSIISFYAFLCNFVSGVLFGISTDVLNTHKRCVLMVSRILSTSELELFFAEYFVSSYLLLFCSFPVSDGLVNFPFDSSAVLEAKDCTSLLLVVTLNILTYIFNNMPF